MESNGKPHSKRRGWARFLTFLCTAFLAILTGGFIAFAQYVDRIQPPDNLQIADGIVVWTGKGGGRLEAGGALLQAKKGERLLISGVHEDNTSEQIAEIAQLPSDLAACCLDIDYAAIDTVGNARETASWALALDFDHIILVTSAYHMPRAEVEIASAAGRIKITPYPVKRADSRKWYKSADRAERLVQEYSKLLLSYTRGRTSHVQSPELEDPPRSTSVEN
jgi:uncharacterized SAM-binding protein YcdF (DUF218 family)